MQSFKEERRSIWRTCRKRKTAFLCRAVEKGVVLYEDGLFTVPYFLEPWGLALPLNEYHSLPLEGSKLRRKTEQHFVKRNCAYRFPLIRLGYRNVLAHTIWMVKWSDEFLRYPVYLLITSCLFRVSLPYVASILNAVALRDIF